MVRCEVPGCGQDVALIKADKQGGGRHSATVCVAHSSEEANAVRFCQGCKALHPLDRFPASGPAKNVCFAAKQRLVEIGLRGKERRRARRQAARQEAIPSFLGLHQANDDQGTNGGRDVGASGFFPSLTVSTNTAKAALFALSPAAGWLLGWRQPHELVPLTLTFVGTFHMLAPHMYQQYYLKPLEDVRAAAAQVGLAVSSSFRFLDLSEHLKFEERALWQSSLGRPCHGMLFLAASGICGAREPTLLMLAAVVLGAVFFLLRWRVSAAQWQGLQQWLGAVACTPAQIMSIRQHFFYDLNGSLACEAFSCLGLLWALILNFTSTALFTMVVDAPLPGLMLLELPKTAVLVVLLASRQGFGSHPPSPLLTCLVCAATAACSMGCAAFRVRSQKRIMMEYIASLAQPAPRRPSPLPLDAIRSPLDKPEERQYLHMICKMANASPADLPHDLRDRLLHALKEEPESLHGVIRPGCVMLALSIRFSSWQRLSGAMASLLSHPQWGETLLGNAQSNVRMAIHRSSYVAHNGALDLQQAASMNAPSIVSVRPAALGPGSRTMDVEVEGLGESGFKLLLRTASSYVELPVVEEQLQPGGGRRVAVQLPASQPPPGLAWVDVMLDTADGSLVASNSSPVMFSPLQRVAVQIAECLLSAPQFLGAPNQLAAFFEDVSDCLHGQATASPKLLLTVIELGMFECAPLLATRRVMRQADQTGQRLLGAAVMSGSLQMVETVVGMLDKYRLPVNPCAQAPDAAGYTPLHWAAIMDCRDIIYYLLGETDHPQDVWRRCRARQCGMTPAEVMEITCPGFALIEDALVSRQDGVIHQDGGEEPVATSPYSNGDAEGNYASAQGPAGGSQEEGQAVLGSGVIAALRGRTAFTKIAILTVYLAAVLQLGWRHSLTWLGLGVTWVALHVVLPYVHSDVYLKGLEEARALAGQQGLRVSKFFSLMDAPEEQRAYHKFVAMQGSRFVNPKYSTPMILAAMVVCSSVNVARTAQMWGMATLAVPVAVVTVLLVGRARAARCGSLRLRQWADAGVLLWCWCAQFANFAVGMASGDAQACNLPSHVLGSETDLTAGVIQVGHCLAFAMFQGLLLDTPGGLVMPMDLLTPIACHLLVLPPLIWCLAAVSMPMSAVMSDPSRLIYNTWACHLIHFVLAAALRLQSTRGSLCAFLRSRAEDCSKAD